MIKRIAGEFGVVVGVVEVYHRKPGSNFVVGGLESGSEPPLKVIGTLAEADLWRLVTLSGVMERDERRSELQFRIKGAIDTDLELDFVRAYLRSGLVWHVGPAIADAITATFGERTLEVLMHTPERLLEVRGLTAPMLAGIRESLAISLPLAAVVGLLHPLGISTTVARAIVRRHGSVGVSIIRANPWALTEYPRVGFAAADAVALRLGKAPDSPERAAAALRHIVKAAADRDGHTVLARDTTVHGAANLIRQPQTLLVETLAAMEDRRELIPIEEPPGVALPELAAAEERLAGALGLLINAPPRPDLEATFDELVSLELASGITFDAAQREAVAGALARGLTVLTGGPGVGKTTIVRAICELAEARDLSVALMSFTGKAAKRLSEATGREATTIHRYLRFVPGSGPAGPENPADVVIVDEVSMLDVVLADELASWLRPDSRLILVGDVDQLPSIGAGNVLGDLTAVKAVPVFRLSVIYRTGAGSGIPMLARDINEGRIELTYDGSTTRFVPRPSSSPDGSSPVADWIRAHFLRYRERVEEFQVLAPIKKGPAGVDALNAVIAEVVRDPKASGRTLNREIYDLRTGDRIIWTVNDYDLGLFNGEIGVLREVGERGGALVEFDGVPYQVPNDKLLSFSLAYALTVHKAQGSEFPIVIVVMDQGAERMLSRRLLYTAVSRARDTVAIVGQAYAVADAVARHDEHPRRTTLGRRLAKALAERNPAPIAEPLDPDALF
jgi:exodeoxyribonuclease V alpha subunit